MINKSSVAIIILNWNSISDTLALLKDLKHLTYPNFSVLVVDNGSTDESISQLTQFQPKAEATYRLSILPLDKNFGFAEGNNQGVAQIGKSKPDYYLLLNNDTVVSSDFLTSLVEAAEVDETLAALAPTIYWANRDGKKTDRPWFAGGWINWFAGGAHHRTELPTVTKPAIAVPFLTGCCMLIRRAAVEQLDYLFDRALFAYNEDIDLSLRLIQQNWRLGYIPKAAIWHKLAGSSGGPKSSNFWYYNVRNNFLILARYGRWYHWPIFILYFLFYKPVLLSVLGAIARPRPDKWQRLGAIAQASWDAAIGRSGQRP